MAFVVKFLREYAYLSSPLIRRYREAYVNGVGQIGRALPCRAFMVAMQHHIAELQYDVLFMGNKEIAFYDFLVIKMFLNINF